MGGEVEVVARVSGRGYACAACRVSRVERDDLAFRAGAPGGCFRGIQR